MSCVGCGASVHSVLSGRCAACDRAVRIEALARTATFVRTWTFWREAPRVVVLPTPELATFIETADDIPYRIGAGHLRKELF